MTLGVAWIRNTGDVREVVVASDSLLHSAGSAETWSGCPKILSLPRTDAIMSFSGVTEFAYPALLQVFRAVGSHPDQVNRAYDLTYLAGFVEEVVNQMDGLAKSDARDSLEHSRRNTTFLLAGYSWKYESFKIWRYAWDSGRRAYRRILCRAEQGSAGQITYRFIGSHDARVDAILATKALVVERELRSLDMEPFTVLVEAIRSRKYADVGGAPQIVKVYRHLNAQFFNTLWKIGGEEAETYAGRPLLHFEKSATPAIDPEAPSSFGKSSMLGT